jgi:hypothetical protein
MQRVRARKSGLAWPNVLQGVLGLFLVVLGSVPGLVEAGCPGCCSSHGGLVEACTPSGFVYCADGTASPSCTGEAYGFAVTEPAELIQWSVTDGGNDHYYEVIIEPGINWFEAKAEAERRGGYLVTIRSQAENDFLFDTFLRNSSYWILGFDPPYEGQAAGPWIGAYKESSEDPNQGWQWLNNDGLLVLLCHFNFGPQNHLIASVLSYRSMSRRRCLCRASSC